MTIKNDKSGNAVIYSFKSKWVQPLKDGNVELFFRKRAPSRTPTRILLYVGSPISSIIGYAEVTSMEKLSPNAALKLAEKGAIDKSELSNYLNDATSVTGIWIARPSIYMRPLSIQDIREVINFHPPQNFMQINAEDALQLDSIAK